MTSLPLPLMPPATGDPARQALASLGGYAYQVYASCIAWLRLDEESELHLEVAEDYATVLDNALLASQVKCSSTNVTLLSEDVISTIDGFVDLVGRNPHYEVSVRLLTTSDIGLERALKNQVSKRSALLAWRDAAENRLSVSHLKRLVRILSSLRLKDETLQFIKSRSPQQLQMDLFSRISWDAGQPGLGTVRQQCVDMLVNLVRDLYELPSQEAAKALPAVLQKVLDTAYHAGPRVLRRADLLTLLDGQFTLSLPQNTVYKLLASAPGQPAESSLNRMQSYSASFASEVDIAGHNILGDALRLSEGLFVPREQGACLLEYLRRSAEQRDVPLSVVVGDAGHGKTSLLWWLYREMVNDQQWLPLFLPASALAKPAAGLGIGAENLEEACKSIRAAGRTPLVLIDTVDLLLRDSEGAIMFAERLAALLAANAHVVLSTRPAELRRIDQGRFPYRPFHLGTYSDPELLLALDTYAARYNYNNAVADAQGEFKRIRNAITSGYPLKDLCVIPLAMRLLFEIHAPHTIQAEVNVFELYCEYWQYRVQADQRMTGLRTDTGGSSGHDCSAVASWLALQMLADGTLELDLAYMTRKLALKGNAVGLLHDLLHRGILQCRAAGTVHFFHQSFFEHASARGLVMLLKSDGIDLLFQRCRERPDDLFLKPILQHALLLAELDGGTFQQSADREFDFLLTNQDLADQCAALHVYCYSHARDTGRAAKVTTMLLNSSASELLRIHFLRNASNMPKQRLAELAPLWEPVWTSASHRVRKHLIQLLGRLASRAPAMVLTQITSLNIHEYVFSVRNARDDAANDYIELLGNLLFSEADPAKTACDFLGDALHAALSSQVRLNCAAQVVSIIGKADRELTERFLQGCRPRHADWGCVNSNLGVDVFARPYTRFWASHWAAQGLTLSQLMASAPVADGSELLVHLLAIDEFLQLEPGSGTSGNLAALETWAAAQAPRIRFAWAHSVIGPLLGRAHLDPGTQTLAHQKLQFALEKGIDAWRHTQHRFELGLASRMLDAARLSPQETAQLFSCLHAPVTPSEWIKWPELTPFLLAAMDGGLADAQAAYAQAVAAPGKHSRVATTLQWRLVAALRDGVGLDRLETLMELIAHTGQAGWLKEVLPQLTAAAKACESFRERMQTIVRETVQGASGKASTSVVRLLPELVNAGIIHTPSMDEAFLWIDTLCELNTRLQLAAWISQFICTSSEDGARLAAWLDRCVLPGLQEAEVPRFPKEQYLRCCAALVRRGLLDPLSPVNEDGTLWSDRLLAITLREPALENHMTWFGWVISAVARTAPARAADLFQKLVGSDTAQEFGQSSQRDLSRHLMSALHAVFYRGDATVRSGLLEFARTFPKPRLVRSVIQIALECNDSALNPKLVQLRADPGFDADLRELILRFRRHNPDLDTMTAWSELQGKLSSCTLPAYPRQPVTAAS